ncbi:Uncharacterized protein TPAR_07395 [Tolypocladium paradoxum]|uniref:SWR1-complex protein 3 domain-containing protein n=1 Tax=Tolypocladium paradoxum TaxID=94208 RepID=A0A2S4KQC9_9HYPO|nr:Uncharacterized protein TPAR_07395 [Tolypocladium paradoxum]
MERKRKLPPRAAARVEQAAKRRNVTPREQSSTPAPAEPVREPTPPPPPPPPLPTSIQVGKPLPMVEDAQPGDLSAKEYQSISESGVLAESLARSRQKWISEGLFEKYWTKPHKRKGVLLEDPKNPLKDSMTKVGIVTITIEPHIVEATMFVVKASKLPPQQQPQQSAEQQQHPPGQQQNSHLQSQPKQHPQPAPARPVLQYGPPNGSMPPPPTPPSTAVATPTTAAGTPGLVAPPSPATNPSPASQSPAPQQRPHVPAAQPPKAASHAPVVNNGASSASPGIPPRPSPAPSPLPRATTPQAAANRPPSNPPARPAVAPPPANNPLAHPATRPVMNAAPAPSPTAARQPAPAAGAPGTAAPKPACNDPVIALLAQKACGDPELRELMKRVAAGQAKDGELAKFQKIIDQLNAEYKQRGGQQGPSADRLLVDGRTVKYFADEVRTILDIVLASNPNQKSTELRPPPRSDPLVVLLVKTALEDQRTKDMIGRIAQGRPGFTDAQDLKEILDRLHRDAKTVPKGPPPVPQPPPAKQPVLNGLPNGHAKAANSHAVQHANPQALRSKGPPPVARPDISAVVFDFGNGDRYLFPKYSILEFLPTQSGQQVVASFLIVRKGSISDYGGDPTLDYYQPLTIRLQTNTGRHLENLARVVAPQDEVRRYMDDVMDNMTRAEYILLAMRLPRVERDSDQDAAAAIDEPKTNGSTPKSDPEPEHGQAANPGVLWTTGPANKLLDAPDTIKFRDPEQESQTKYEHLIRSVAARDREAI